MSRATPVPRVREWRCGGRPQVTWKIATDYEFANVFAEGLSLTLSPPNVTIMPSQVAVGIPTNISAPVPSVPGITWKNGTVVPFNITGTPPPLSALCAAAGFR